MARWNEPDEDRDGDEPEAAAHPDEDEALDEDEGDDDDDDEGDGDGDEDEAAEPAAEPAPPRRAAEDEVEFDAEEFDEGEEGEDAAGDADLDLGFDDDLEDEYADYVDEELGYADIDWDSIPQAEVDRHQRLRKLGSNELDEVDTGSLSDFDRWAVARAYLDHSDEVAFETVALPLLGSTKRTPALDYIDIALAIMSRKAKRGDFEAAFALLDQLRKVSNDENLVARFRGILMIQQGKSAEGLELLAQLAETRPDDPDFLLSLGEDLCGIGLWEEAVEYLEIAEDLARERGDQDLLSSIENAVQFAQRQLGFEDVKDE